MNGVLGSALRGHPVRVSMISDLPASMAVCDRMREIAGAAASDVLASSRDSGFPKALGLLLSVPRHRPGLHLDLPARLMDAVRARVQGLAPIMASECLSGSAGGLEAFTYARDLLLRRRCDVCLV